MSKDGAARLETVPAAMAHAATNNLQASKERRQTPFGLEPVSSCDWALASSSARAHASTCKQNPRTLPNASPSKLGKI
jgi:hypothetical protein